MPFPSIAPGERSDRLDELEIRVGYLDDLVDTLNRTVFRQQQQIDQLSKALAQLRQQMSAASTSPAPEPRDEVPPHY